MRNLLFCVMVFLLACPLSYATEMNNPGFESGEEGWYNWNDGESGGMISSEFIHSGSNSACRQVLGMGQGCFGQAIPVNPGETIKASAWVMNPESKQLSNGAEAYVRIEFWNVDGPLASGHKESEHIKKATEWKKIEAVGVVPQGTTEARILVFSKGIAGSTGEAYFDDVEISIEKGQ